MHEDRSNLVVVNEDSASEMPGNEGDVDADVADGDAERNTVSVDTKVEQLLTAAQTSHEESATTSGVSFLSSITQDLTMSKKTGNGGHKDKHKGKHCSQSLET